MLTLYIGKIKIGKNHPDFTAINNIMYLMLYSNTRDGKGTAYYKYMNENDTLLYLLVGIIAAIFLILLLFAFVSFPNDFRSELRYSNNEIHRTDGEERRHYIRQRRRLWLSLIPFVKY